MAHKSNQLTVVEIANRWGSDNIPWWWPLEETDALEANHELIEAGEENMDRLFDVEAELEAEYLHAHGNEIYCVRQAECSTHDAVTAGGKLASDCDFVKT